MKSITAIIQARMGSSRLPGKVLLDIEGKTVLDRVIERTKRAKGIDRAIIAIPDTSSDDVLAKYCEERSIPYFRGSEADVLDRYYQTAKHFNIAHIVRITSDCPLIDPEVIDRVINEYHAGGYDYISTGRIETTYPDGLDVELFSFTTLEKARNEAMLPSEREHVTPYIWNHPEIFNIETVVNSKDLSLHRWTVDEPADLEFVRGVYKKFPENKLFCLKEILHLLEINPEIKNINSGISRNSGYFKSLKKEGGFIDP